MRLLDTSVAVDHLRGHRPASRLLAELVTAGEQLCASELSRFELLSGVRPAELERVEAFFGVLDWVPVTEAIARHAASYAAAFRRSPRVSVSWTTYSPERPPSWVRSS